MRELATWRGGFPGSGAVYSMSCKRCLFWNCAVYFEIAASFDGTGGVAFGGFNTDVQLAALSGTVVPPFFASNNFSTTRVGWTAGGGLQYAVTNNWWVFVEYRFSDFGTVRNGAFPNLPAGVFFNGERRLQENHVQAGFSYKFDLYAPPPGRREILNQTPANCLEHSLWKSRPQDRVFRRAAEVRAHRFDKGE
jgi:hypothetical protein